MIKKLTLIVIIFMELHIGINSFAQCPGFNTSLDESEARNRRQLFNIFKKGALTSLNIKAGDFQIPAASLQSVLQKFADHKNPAYDGVRFYIAVSNDSRPSDFDKNTLYLVLVPTSESTTLDDDGLPISDDDETNVYIIDKHSNFQNFNISSNQFIINWENRYLNKIAPRIENKFRNHLGINFEESHSIWFSAAVLFKSQDGEDLLKNLSTPECQITQVNFDFACWTHNDPYYAFETDLLFEITDQKNIKPYFISLGAQEIKLNIQKLQNQYDSLLNFNLQNAKISSQDSTLQKNSIDAQDLLEEIKILKNTEYVNTGNPCPQKKCP